MNFNFKAQKFKAHEILVYQLNLKGLPMDLLLEEKFPVAHTLTTYDGTQVNIHIESDLQFRIDSKEQKYPPSHLFTLIYGISNETAKKVAFQYESSMFGPFQVAPDLLNREVDRLPHSYDSFQKNTKLQNVGFDWDEFHQRLTVYCLSPAGYCVANKVYKLQGDHLSWENEGVFRLDLKLFSSSQDFVVVTDTPIEADFLLSAGIPAFSIPSESEVSHYPYSEFLKSKKVFICSAKYGATYSYSVYPLATELLKKRIELHHIQPNQLNKDFWNSITNKKSEPTTIHSLLMQSAEPLRASTIPSRGAYNELIESTEKPSVHLAQDYFNQFLLYGMTTKEVVLSNPIRSFVPAKLTDFEGVVPYPVEEFPDSGLTRFMVEKIRTGDVWSPQETYKRLHAFFKRFIYFKHDEYVDILCCWIMATYVFRVFKAFPYLHLVGNRGSGKSTMLELVTQLSFNGFFQTKATISTSVERAHLHSSTLCIDEFEDYSGRKNSHDELSKFLNSGYNYLGSFTKRVRTKSTTFFTYCPKIFGGTGDITIDTLKSRTIPIKTSIKPSSVNKEQFLEFDEPTRNHLQQLKTSLYGLGLLHAQQVYLFSMRLDSDITLSTSGNTLDNRQLELARPLLTIASLLEDQELQTSLLKGLDLCWYPTIKYTRERDLELHEVLTTYFNSIEPLKTKDDYPGFVIYNAKKIDQDPQIKTFWHKENIGKVRFNKLIYDTFGIERTGDIRVPEIKNPSCYKVPSSFFKI